MRRSRIASPWAELPLVSVGLAAVLLLSFLLIQLGFASRREAAHRGLHEAVEFAIHHPVVEIDPRLLPVVRAVLPGFEGNELFAFLARGGGGQAADARSKQEQFDALATQGFAALDAQPERVLGVVPANPSWHGPLSYVLVHAGWVHVLSTVALLLLSGPLLEEIWGRRLFAGALAITGLGGAGAFLLVHGGLDRALLGASTWVAGLVAAVALRFWSQRLDFARWLSPMVRVELRAPFWALAVVWGLYEGLLAWAVRGSLPAGVDHAVGYTGHLAAAAAGGLLAFGISRAGLEARFGRASGSVVSARFDFAAVRQARARGDVDAALELLLAETRRSARSRDAVALLWAIAVERGDPQLAVPAMRQLVEEELRRGAFPAAAAQWHELAQHVPHELLPPSTLLRLIPYIQQEYGEKLAILALRQAVEGEEALPVPQLTYEIAMLAGYLDRDLAVAAARRALAAQELNEVQRSQLTALLDGEEKPEDEAPARAGGAPAHGEVPLVDAFADGCDRSAFGEVGELGELAEADTEQRNPESAPLERRIRFPEGAVTLAVPRALDDEVLTIEVPGRAPTRLGYSRVRAVAVVGVRGFGPRPVVLVDLVTRASTPSGKPLQIVRFRSDQYDPNRLVSGCETPLQALHAMVDRVLSRAGARPLPDAGIGSARPLRIFDSIEDYHAQILAPAADEL